ncbi:MAG: hypothetical protein LQ337_005465 [Flavoplaca oasis]|nr:MAG: hypothetical protein LQ337_005465 [Flavoplaca oasis]
MLSAVSLLLLSVLSLASHHSLSYAAPTTSDPCPPYEAFSRSRSNKNLSPGRHQLPLQRPVERCRKFPSPALEKTITRLRDKIADPDLFRLFENSYPNTLDTAVLWTGFAARDASAPDSSDAFDEDLAFVITGDINAMWLRDSANQILSYLPLLEPSESPKTIAALFRGIINLQSRYIKISPYCHAFQPPPESNIALGTNHAYFLNKVNPPYDRSKTFDCKWELDSLASFLQISSEYHKSTGDMRPFIRYSWVETVKVILDAVEAMRHATYTPDGHIAPSGYTMTGQTNRATETTSNDGLGNPVKWTGMIRSTFRPSDDATIHQFLIPSNMMFARCLEAASAIMAKINSEEAKNLTDRMRTMAGEIRAGIAKYGVVHHPQFGSIFAFEVDGYGSHNFMDDANLPSLLSATMMGFVSPHDEVYLNTRLFALSEENPYWAKGPVLNAIGGPHLGPGRGWPLASIVRILTSLDGTGEEAKAEMMAILNTTDGLGLIHESITSHNVKDWTRPW